MPLNALRGILEYDSHTLYLVADSVGFCPVLLFSRLCSCLDKSLDILCERILLSVVNNTENARQLVVC